MLKKKKVKLITLSPMGLWCCHSKIWNGILMAHESCHEGRRQMAKIISYFCLWSGIWRKSCNSELPFGHYSQRYEKDRLEVLFQNTLSAGTQGWRGPPRRGCQRLCGEGGAPAVLREAPRPFRWEQWVPRDVVCFIYTSRHLCHFFSFGEINKCFP